MIELSSGYVVNNYFRDDSDETGIIHLVRQENSLCVGLVPILFGVLRKLSSARLISVPSSIDLNINAFAILTVVSAFPLPSL
jgi:hypothetical protein